MSQLCKCVQYAYRSKNLLRVNMHRQRSISNFAGRVPAPKYIELGHFTLLFCRRRQRNVPRFKTHVHSHCSAFAWCRSRRRRLGGLLKLPNICAVVDWEMRGLMRLRTPIACIACSLFQRDSDQRYVTRIWLDYENKTNVNKMKKNKNT